LEAAHHVLIYFHHSCRVVKFSAVVWRRKECHKLAISKKLIAIFNDLVSATNQVDVIFLDEFVHDVFSEGEGDTSVVVTPIVDLLVGVGPQKVAQQASVWHIRGPHNVVNCQNPVQLRGQAAVHAEDFVIDERSDGQAVEAVGKNFPKLDSIATLALIVKAVNTVDLGTFVVSSK
jgi:hypothetical protein